ncbi:MAG: XisI protein [Chloroflexales bacterium]|nr:XisI protein [Chloroflexales bacterium]
MAKLDGYRHYIQQILEEYCQYQPAYGDVEMELIIDTERDHYQLMSVGWHNQRRIHGVLIHIDIRHGQIWIQHDGTEGGIANELVKLGVPKEDIVLAFHAPYKRPYTGFGTGTERTPHQTAS